MKIFPLLGAVLATFSGLSAIPGALAADPRIDTISPTSVTGASLPTRTSFSVQGANFINGAKVRVTWNNDQSTPTDIPVQYTSFVGSTRIDFSVATDTTPDTWRVRIVNPDGKQSNGINFTVTGPIPSMTLNAPNAGATWRVGTSQTVSWSVSGNTSQVSYFVVRLSTNGGNSYSDISSNLNSSTRSFNYTPMASQVGTNAVCWVRAFNSSGTFLVGAISSDAFTIANPSPPNFTLNINSSNPSSGVAVNSYVGSGSFQSGTTPMSRSFVSGTTVGVTCPTTLSSGNVFQKWQLDGANYSTSDVISVTMNSNHTLTAVYSSPPPDYALSINSTNPSNGVAVNSYVGTSNFQSGTTPTSRSFVAGTTVGVTCPTTLTSGNTFQKWQLDGVDYSTSEVISVTMNANHTLTAIYISPPPNYTLNINSSNPASGVAVNSYVGTGSFQSGTTPTSRTFPSGTTVEVTCPRTLTSGNTFQKWQRDGSDLTNSDTATITMDGNHTLTAVYAFNPTPTPSPSASPSASPSPSSSPSPSATVAPPGQLTANVHPAAAAAIANENTGDVDAPLTLRPVATLLRGNQSAFFQGLVADGVTPLILQIDSANFPTNSYTYEISANIIGGSISTGPLEQYFRVLTGGSQPAFVQGNSITISSSRPTAFAYLSGIRSEDIRLSTGSQELTVTLSIARPGYSTAASLQFSIRRPPIALVHGYRSSKDAWSSSFLSHLYQTNAPDFVIRTEYGVSRANGTVNNDENTFGTLTYLASILDAALKSQVEEPLRQAWAFTRYDIVGHSQGGVLARMLCTSRQPFFATAFRSAPNLYRGRFHRVITIGSPHNGSTFVYYLQQKQARSGGIWTIPNFLEILGFLQPKFLPPFGINTQLDEINAPNGNWSADPSAKVHLIGTTIYGGNPPLYSINPVTQLGNPLSYRITGLAEGTSLFGPSRGLAVFPLGSDGIVDFSSQLAGGGAPFDNLSADLGVDIAHAGGPLLFGIGDGVTGTQYQGVADDVRSLLAGPVEQKFGTFVPKPILSYVKGDIDSVIPGAATGGSINAAGAALYSMRLVGGKVSGVLTYQFRLTADPAEPIDSPPVWYTQTFGPSGTTNGGATVSVDTADPKKVIVSVDDDAVGTIVLYESYGSQSGKVIVAQPITVVSRPPGDTLVGIELVPATLNLSVGSHIMSEVWARFSNGTRSRIYLPVGNGARYTSSNPVVATVDLQGEIILQAAGDTIITASYLNFSAQSFITVFNEAPAPTSPTALGNISTRLNVATGDNVLIGGFIITGSQSKKVIVRAIGPSLAQFGLSGVLTNPTLELHDSTGQTIAVNDDWNDNANSQDISNSMLAPTNDNESALLRELSPGAYTAIVRGVNNTTGVGLIEVYDLDQTVPSKLANISTRGFVGTGDNVMIGGSIVVGNVPATVLIRAIGPSLTNLGVPNALQDPTLELHDSNGVLMASNDNWRSDEGTAILASALAPTDERESAILRTLSPGAYTAIVRGSDNSSGIALVEMYQLDN